MMIKNLLALTTLLSLSIYSSLSRAHDPSEHQGVAEEPKCEALEKMKQTGASATDPVMLALKKKCEDALHAHDEEDSHGDEKKDDHH